MNASTPGHAASGTAAGGQNVNIGDIGASASVKVEQTASQGSAAQSVEAGSVGEGAKIDIRQSQ